LVLPYFEVVNASMLNSNFKIRQNQTP